VHASCATLACINYCSVFASILKYAVIEAGG